MGLQEFHVEDTHASLQKFTKKLLTDLRALEYMIDHGLIETGIRRIGAEQEMFLVDQSWHPTPRCTQMIKALQDSHYTTELAQFNLEANMDPQVFGGNCLRRLENQIVELVEKARVAAHSMDTEVLLTGILPTLQHSDLDLANMTPVPRYKALNQALTQLRGSAYEFKIAGVDEISFKHYSVMLEACNTSFQLHFQCGPEEFSGLYNLAQTISAPVLAAAVNSPILFGKRLWRETRIALFQQSVDTRNSRANLREISPRVNFGNHWIDRGVLEIFQEDIVRFKVLLGTEIEEDPFEVLAAGKVPRLRALSLHNGTIYRWNRPCYGISEGKPHLRIECRFMPAGPTPLDEVANAALWYGLMSALSHDHPDVRDLMEFDQVKHNFIAAARSGLDANLTWFGGKRYSAQDLVCNELLPQARSGLERAGIDRADIDRYLGVLEGRVKSGRTGATWLIDSFTRMKKAGVGTRSERLAALTAATIARQRTGLPGHEWEEARLEEAGGWLHNYRRVEQFMTTDLFTVNENEIVDLVANIMDWRRVRHVPVEDSQHRLVGLVSYRSLLRFLARGSASGEKTVPVRELMQTNVVTIAPETPTLEAIKLMREKRVACLPVVKDDQLVGIITEADFMDVARRLLEGVLERLGPEVFEATTT
ncbi:MAG: CBS domain-containing protein [Planctomycetota bacterium]